MIEWLKLLGLHALGFILTMFAMLGIPGNLSLNSRILNVLSAFFNIFLYAGWVGVPILLVASVIVKWMGYSEWSFVLGYISLMSGLLCFLTLLFIYQVKDNRANK